MNDDARFEFGGRVLHLRREPEDATLRAWDAADRYALDHLVEHTTPSMRVLLINDGFGALACALADRDRTSWSDSELARRALRVNEQRNAIGAAATWRFADVEPDGRFDVAVVKIPRERSLLDFLLARARRHLSDGALVIGAGMTRNVHTSTIESFERWIGPAPTTPARQKARLILARVEAAVQSPPDPLRFDVADFGLRCVAHAGVFAQKQLDAGTELLLRHLPVLAGLGEGLVIADVGCGCGILAAAAARSNPRATVVAADESALALLSTRETFAASALPPTRFLRTDGLDHLPDASVDLVLSNPPQHQHANVSQTLLERVLDETHRVLRPQGEAWMVANRHVNLNVALHQYFGRVRIVDQDRRYMVCSAGQPR